MRNKNKDKFNKVVLMTKRKNTQKIVLQKQPRPKLAHKIQKKRVGKEVQMHQQDKTIQTKNNKNKQKVMYSCFNAEKR